MKEQDTWSRTPLQYAPHQQAEDEEEEAEEAEEAADAGKEHQH